jgi:hypothetical protein
VAIRRVVRIGIDVGPFGFCSASDSPRPYSFAVVASGAFITLSAIEIMGPDTPFYTAAALAVGG